MAIDEKLVDVQSKIEGAFGRIGRGKYARILKMARKPTREEFSKTSIITGVGIIIIGGIGFIIYLIMNVFFQVP
jgi:protein translocase SEC61 complex gamma subunit, archaeal and eukaryotic